MPPTSSSTSPSELYLDLLEGCLTRSVIPESYEPIGTPTKAVYRWALPLLRRCLNRKGLSLMRSYASNPEDRAGGRDWPPDAETMIGLKRLENLRDCVRTIVEENIPGDLIETGVWRGGASIFMRGALNAYGDESRSVWLADSFQGLPKPNADKYAHDAGDELWKHSDYLGVSLEQVKKNFQRYGLLDDRVHFLKGWFSETLRSAPIDSLAIMRLDGDMYESTMDAMEALYPKLSPGGFVIVDDYFLAPCRAAIHDYRDAQGISDPILHIDGIGVYWRRPL